MLVAGNLASNDSNVTRIYNLGFGDRKCNLDKLVSFRKCEVHNNKRKINQNIKDECLRLYVIYTSGIWWHSEYNATNLQE